MFLAETQRRIKPIGSAVISHVFRPIPYRFGAPQYVANLTGLDRIYENALSGEFFAQMMDIGTGMAANHLLAAIQYRQHDQVGCDWIPEIEKNLQNPMFGFGQQSHGIFLR